MKILIMIGSSFTHGHTRALGEAIQGSIEQPENDVTLIDLSEFDIPLLGKDDTDDLIYIKSLVHEADAVIIGTPNYHASFSGLLKVMLDHLSMDAFKLKPVALICNSGGIKNPEPVTQLRIVMRGLQALVIPTQILTSNSDFVEFQKGYILNCETTAQRIGVLVDQLMGCVVKS